MLLPGTPHALDKTLQTQGANLVMHTLSYRGVIAYFVMYADYPVSVEGGTLVKKFFDDMRDSAMSTVVQASPRVVKEADFSLAGHPGRFFQIELSDDRVLRIKYIAVKNRVYNLIATSRKAQPNVMGSANDYEEIAMAFLDSFQLTKP